MVGQYCGYTSFRKGIHLGGIQEEVQGIQCTGEYHGIEEKRI
jgi:hypothetical protein